MKKKHPDRKFDGLYPEERFWSKVKKTKTCWNWTGYKKGDYGAMSFRGVVQPAHRIAYELVNGRVPKGLVLDHLCRNQLCVNPGHLEAVTQRENILRGNGASSVNAKKTHCVNGHKITGANSYRRFCKKCKSKYEKGYRTRMKAIKTKHKDTVRLDFMIRVEGAVMGYEGKYWVVVEAPDDCDATIVLGGYHKTPRKAIDSARRAERKK